MPSNESSDRRSAASRTSRSDAARDASGRPATLADPDPRIRPTAAVLLGVEALGMLAIATYCLVMVGGGSLYPRIGIGLALFLLLFAVGAVAAARSVLARGRFGLGYGITWQLFQALVGASMLRGALYWQGGLALGLAIALFALLTTLVRSTPLPERD
ncbi:hypothetical protein ACXET9_12275 [Brachybacterium sp. DNPG3]